MTSVSKPAADSVSRSPRSPGEAEGATPREGEFDRVLKEKAGGRAHSLRPDLENSRSGTERGPGSRRQRPDEAPALRALPGDVAIAYPIRAAGTAQAPEPTPAADRVAEIQRITDQIVQAVEVRLGRDGVAEARLELNLGSLGRMGVALERTAEGQIRIGFEAATAEASDLLRGRVSDLATELQARGVSLQEITVQSPDQPVFRFEPPTGPADAVFSNRPEPSPPPGEAAQGQRQPFQDQERQRRRPSPEPLSDDE